MYHKKTKLIKFLTEHKDKGCLFVGICYTGTFDNYHRTTSGQPAD